MFIENENWTYYNGMKIGHTIMDTPVIQAKLTSNELDELVRRVMGQRTDLPDHITKLGNWLLSKLSFSFSFFLHMLVIATF